VTFDSEVYKIVGQVRSDKYEIVDVSKIGYGEEDDSLREIDTFDAHIDWFSEMAAKADSVGILEQGR